MKSKYGIIAVPLIAAAFLFGCAPKAAQKTEAGKAKPIIAVSVLPHSYFLERIGGDSIQSLVIVGPGQSPHSYEPSPQQMQDLSKASAWILSNSDFEVSLKPKIASLYPSLLLVDGTEGVQFRKMEAHSHGEEEHQDMAHEDHGEETEEEHHEIELDLHTWLGRENAKIFSRHVRDTLTKILPENKETYETRYQDLVNEIDGVFNQLVQDLAPLKGSKVFVFHPSFGYFFDEFGIQQEAIETGGKEPSAQTLAEIIEEARADQVKVIFVQTQFPTSAAKTVADSLGAQVAPLDPLAKDWMGNIKVMGEALKKAAK